jgi:signal transduction histidine kinase
MFRASNSDARGRHVVSASSLPLHFEPAPVFERVRSVTPARRADEIIAEGLRAISAEVTTGGIDRAICSLAGRLPGVGGVAILRSDDRGLLKVACAHLKAPLADDLALVAGASLHQRWIASHAPDAPALAFGPYVVEERPELLIAPFVQADHLLGGLVMAGKGEKTPCSSPAERISVGAIAVVAAQALEAAQLRQRVDFSVSRSEHEAELNSFRKNVSRDLHDGPTQDLALASLTLDRLIDSLGKEQAASADARQARDLIDRSVDGMRKIIGKVRSTKPPAPSITGPLRALLAELAPTAPDFQVDFQEVSGVCLGPEVERAMVGIVREALHNVRKHAQAESVHLEVRRVDGAVEIAVTDDGVGIQGDTPAGHFGLEQIRELAEESGGDLAIESATGTGTTVKARIPLPKPLATDVLGRSPEPGRMAPDRA